MTVEELLMPRYKVIADYPNTPYGLNQVLTKREIRFGMGSLSPENYPAIFRKLNWWEERKVEDMPDYVKWDVGIYPTWKKIMKVDKWNSNGSFDHENVTISVINCFPATEQQYNDYINSKSNAKH